MKTGTNQELILGNLLGFSKTTGQLARELNYVNAKGVAGYSIIYDDLTRLVESGYIEGKKQKLEKKPGNIPTLYSIIINIQNLRNILREYPHLISNMQKNDLVLENIICEYSDLLYNSINKEHVKSIACVNSNFHRGGTSVTKSEKIIISPSGDEKRVEERLYTSVMHFDGSNVTSDPDKTELLVQNVSPLKEDVRVLEIESITITGVRPSNVTSDPNKKELYGQTEETLIEKSKENLMKKLQLSPEFFRLFLMNDKNNLVKYIKECIKILEDVEINVTAWEVHNSPSNWYEICEINLGLDVAFEACVTIDMMQGQSNKEAIEYIRLKKKEVSDKQICQLEDYYKSTKVVPEFLRGKKLIYAGCLKTNSILQLG
jgi:hypothetical protein